MSLNAKEPVKNSPVIRIRLLRLNRCMTFLTQQLVRLFQTGENKRKKMLFEGVSLPGCPVPNGSEPIGNYFISRIFQYIDFD